MTESLEPCPFCGKPARIVEFKVEGESRSRYRVECRHRGGCWLANTPSHESEFADNLAEWWNERCRGRRE